MKDERNAYNVWIGEAKTKARKRKEDSMRERKKRRNGKEKKRKDGEEW